MDHALGLVSSLGPATLVAALLIALLAGTVKGLTGFAMPMVMISGLSILMPPDLALATLIIPTVLTNLWQALRQGLAAAVRIVRRFRLFLVCLVVLLALSAQLVTALPQRGLFLLIGVPVTIFAMLNLAGWRPRLPARAWPVEAAVGGVAGFLGGVSGVWGPPTVIYLTALDLPKAEHVRAQGVVYGIGAVALLAAHLQSGVLRAETVPLSLMMVVPALAGMALGQAVQDRIDQRAFRRAVLVVLLVAGANLVRRGVM